MNKLQKLLSILLVGFGILVSLSAEALPVGAGFPPSAATAGESAYFMQYQNVYLSNSGSVPGVTNATANVNFFLVGGSHTMLGGRLTLSFFLPYVNKSAGFTTTGFGPDGPVPLNVGFKTSALADPVGFIQWIWATSAWEGGFMSSAVFTSITAPLGTYNSIDANFGPIPRFLQSGGGLWVPTFGVTFLYINPQYEFYAVTSYGVPFEARGYKAGNVLNYAAEFGYRIIPWTLKTLTHYPVYVKAIFEFLGTLTGRLKTPNPAFDGLPDHSGGNVIRIAPGIEFQWDQWVLSMSYQFPISETQNGDQIVKQKRQVVAVFGVIL